MSWQSLVSILILAVTTGILAYCLSCTFHVWRSRNAARARTTVPFRLRRLRAAARVAVAAGAGVIVGLLLREALTQREGFLRGDSLHVQRAQGKLEVADVTLASSVQPGDILVRFRSPEESARLETLRLELRRLETETEIVTRAPLEPDGEITRELSEARTEIRELRARVEAARTALGQLSLDDSRDRALLEAERYRLETEREDLTKERADFVARLRLVEGRFERSLRLHESKAIPEEEIQERKTELELAKRAVAGVDERLESVRLRSAALEEELDALRVANKAQSSTISQQLAENQRRLEELHAREEDLSRRLAKDLEVARQRRDARLRQLEIDRRTLAEDMVAVRETLERRAPFAGQVVFREPSPGSAREGDPLVVVAPGHGLRLQARLPERDRGALDAAGPVTLELSEKAQTDFGEVETISGERRFAAFLAGWRDLPRDPGYGLADLVCELPPDAVRALTAGQEIRARLVWWPPLWASPAFAMASVLAAFGISLLLAARVAARGTRGASEEGVGERLDGDRASLIEAGAEGAMLRLLGKQLRAAVLEDDVQDDLLAAVEWSLDRHHARAARHLAIGLGDSADPCQAIRRAVLGNGHPGLHARSSRERERYSRLLRILRAIGDDRLRDCLRDLDSPRLDLESDIPLVVFDDLLDGESETAAAFGRRGSA